MNAKDIESSIRQGEWLAGLSLKHCPFIAKMRTPPTAKYHREVTVRIPSELKTRFDKPKPQRRRIDVVALVKPHYKAWGNELFSVGFEIKVSESDLKCDKKYTDYLGYSDYFLFAVPTGLVSAAKHKINGDPRIGLFDTESSEILVMPERQEVTDKNAFELYRQIAFME